MTIELDFDNNSLLRNYYPYLEYKSHGIEHIETENMYEPIGGGKRRRMSRDWNPINYRFVGTRYVYKVEDKKKFLLIVMNTGIKYKELSLFEYD